MESRVTPVYVALTEPKLVAGVEARLAILNGTLMMVFVVHLHVWQFLIVGVLLHMVLRWMTKNDPFMRVIYIRYARQRNRYEPWPKRSNRYNKRPEGFSRDMLC